MADRKAYKREYKRKLRAEGRLKTLAVEFYGDDVALYDHVAASGSAGGYVKELIRKDMGADHA